MSFFHPNNVIEESLGLLFLTGLLGLRAFGPCRRRWISYFYAFFLAIFHCCLFLAIRGWTRGHYEKYQEVIYYFKLQEKLPSFIRLVVVPAIILSSVLKSSENYNAYKIIDEVDKGLRYLNHSIDHNLQMRKELAWLTIYVSTTIAVNLLTYFAVSNMDCGHLFNLSWILDHLPNFFEIVTLCVFHTFVEKILVRFQMVNNVVCSLINQAQRKVSVVLVRSTDTNNAAKLRLARRVHLQLHDAASTINRAYGLRLFFIFFASVISALTHFRRSLDLRDDFVQLVDLILHVIWICFDVGKYFYLANTCRLADAEAKLPARFFIEEFGIRGHDGLSDEVEAFSCQLITKKFDVTVWTIFSIDLVKGLTILVGITIYFLLLG